MTRKALWVDGCSTPGWVKERLKLITQGRLQSRAYGSVGCAIRQMSGVAKLYNLSLQREVDAFLDKWRLQRMDAELYGRAGQSAQPKYRAEAEALAGLQGSRGHGNNVAQLEGPSPRARPGAAKWREATKMIEQNRNPPHKVVGGIESRQQNIDSLKVEVGRVGDIKARLTRCIAADSVLEIQEPEPLSSEEEEQSLVISEEGATQTLRRQHLTAEELLSKAHLRKAHLREGRSTRANCGSRDWSRNSAQENGRTDMHSAGTTSQAITVLQNRLQQTITTDSYRYVKVLQMCSKQRDLLAAKQVHDYIIRSGMDKNLYVAVTLLNVYIKCGALLDARRVFDQLEKKSVVTWTNMIGGYAKSDHAESALELFNQMRQEGVQPDEIAWNVMIGGLAQHGCRHEAYRLFLQMRREGFEPDAITYVSILNASASEGALEWVKEVHGHASKAGLESDLRVGTALVQLYAKSGSVEDAQLVFNRMEKRDVVSWNVMIGGLAQDGCGHEAYRLFLQMRREGLEPNAVTYISILNASASEGALEWVKEVHGHASKAGLESDLRVGNALVHMYAKSGSIDDALLVFNRMEKRDVITWNAIIGGLAQHGCGNEALKLFRKMTIDGVKADSVSFVAVLSACCHGGLVDDGRKLFSSMMQDYGIDPEIVHYTCMVDLLGRAGHLAEAKLFISDMPVEPNAVTWKALLGACRTYGNVELGELAAKEVLKLEPNDASVYVLLSNIYAAAGKWENVSLVRTMMQERGVRKEPGRSKVDNKVHEFIVGDTSHPEAEVIYTELNKLTEKLKATFRIPGLCCMISRRRIKN